MAGSRIDAEVCCRASSEMAVLLFLPNRYGAMMQSVTLVSWSMAPRAADWK